MKSSVKAALFSALVYPGMGHLLLKKYAMSALFAVTFSVPLYFMMSDLIAKAQQIVLQINNGEIPLDIAAISAALTHSIAGVEGQALNSKMTVLLIIWLLAIADAYRLGRKQKNGSE
jgi:hypothetical protein